MMPFMIHEAPVSPGCTREDMITPFLFIDSLSLLLVLLVIVRSSHLFPAKVWQSVDLVRNEDEFGIFSISSRSFSK